MTSALRITPSIPDCDELWLCSQQFVATWRGAPSRCQKEINTKKIIQTEKQPHTSAQLKESDTVAKPPPNQRNKVGSSWFCLGASAGGRHMLA